MSRRAIEACIRGKGLSGEALGEAEALLKLYDDLGGDGARIAADADLRQLLVEAIETKHQRARFQDALQVVKTAEAVANAQRHTPGKMLNGIQALLGFDIHHRTNDVLNVETLHHANVADAWRYMAEIAEDFRAKGANLKRDIEGEEDLVRALFGELDGPSARTYRAGWQAANRHQIAEFRRHGGWMPEKADWVMPNPSHDQGRILRAGRDTWKAFTRDRLDRERMIDWDTGRPMGDGKLDQILDEVFETVSTGGLNKIEPGKPGGRKVANMRSDPRVLQFAGAEAWLDYNRTFGTGEIFAGLYRHVDALARDTALLQVLGPNPDHTFRVLMDTARKMGDRGILGKPRLVEAQYRIVAGIDPVQGEAFASAMQNVRNLFVAQQLGGAFLTSLSDWAFIKKTAEFNGLSAARVLSDYGRLIGSREARINATRQGIIADDMLGSAVTAGRYADALARGQVTGRVADVVLRLSWLTQHTRIARQAVAKSIHGEIQDNIGRSFGALDEPFRRMLERYGIRAEEWAIVQRAEPVPFRGVDWFEPSRLLEIDGVAPDRLRDLALRIRSMVIQEQNFAVPTSNARVQSLITGGTERGTIVGEAARFIGMYKRFPVLILHTHAMRALAAPGVSVGGRIGYAASTGIYTTIMGTLAWELGELVSGREWVDPLEHTEPWGRGLLKGGALGFWGDIILADTSKYGRGPAQALLGPAFDLINDTAQLTVGNAWEALNGKPTHLGRELVRYFDRYLTPGSSLWQVKLAWDRIVTDQLMRAVDPGYFAKRRRRLERTAAKERDQHYWWAPGDIP